MDTLHHGIMSLTWMQEQGFEVALIDAMLPWTMMPDVAQAIHGKPMRQVTHMERDVTEHGQLHYQRTGDFSKIFTEPTTPVLRPPYGCAARVGVLMHYYQDQLYDDWISAIVRQERTDGDSYEYSCRLAGDAPMSESDVIELKKWSWIEGLRHSYESIPGATSAQTLAWTQENILARVEENPYWHPAMSAYARHYHKLALASDGNIPKILQPWKNQVREGLHNAIDDWPVLLVSAPMF